MARSLGRLTAVKVAKAKEPGMYADGGGLYLQVTGSGAKSWIYRFSLDKHAREMGLGSLSAVSLADARNKAAECRRQRQEGIDPIDARKRLLNQAMLATARSVTFKEAAETCIASRRSGWHNSKHAAQWKSTLATYAYPIVGHLSVQAIDTNLVLKVLEPIWQTKPETASRLRGRIESVLDSAKARGICSGENPARWRGHLDQILPRRSKVRAVKHHAALPYNEIGQFIADLRKQEGVAARALEFTILTAARTSETTGAEWNEFTDEVWIVPAERMKARKEHRVPLSERARAIVEALRTAPDANERLVFPGGRRGKPMSNMAMTALLRRMKRHDITVHGFRSSFRDWAAECTNYPNEVVEMALAHAVGDKVEAAYRRGNLLEKRRQLMAEWGWYCSSPHPAKDATVIPLRNHRKVESVT